MSALDQYLRSSEAGEMPDLLTHLWSKYRDHVQGLINQRAAMGIKSKPLEDALKEVPAANFVAWTEIYLEEVRVVESFPAEANFGIRLSTGDTVLICPAVELHGTMQPDTSVPISGRTSRTDTSGSVEI